MKSRFKLITIFGAPIVVMLVSFAMSGLYNTHIDARTYVDQIGEFRALWQGGVMTLDTFKPFYGIVGSFMSLVVSPYLSILIMNISFLFGISILAYLWLRELRFDDEVSVIGALWIVLSYPVLKYGLAISTDISGWFFALLSISIFLSGIRTNKFKYIIYASIVGFLGSISKETGVLGLIFCGVYIICHIGLWQKEKVIKYLSCLCVPFAVLQGILLWTVSRAGSSTLIGWFSSNQNHYGQSYRNLKYFIGVEGSTFNILAILALLGIFIAYRNKDLFSREWLSLYLSLFVASLPVLIWPIFISRIVFIQYIVVIPLAVYFISKMKFELNQQKVVGIPIFYWIIALPPITSLILFISIGNGSFFN